MATVSLSTELARDWDEVTKRILAGSQTGKMRRDLDGLEANNGHPYSDCLTWCRAGYGSQGICLMSLFVNNSTSRIHFIKICTSQYKWAHLSSFKVQALSSGGLMWTWNLISRQGKLEFYFNSFTEIEIPQARMGLLISKGFMLWLVGSRLNRLQQLPILS